ncbi:hypothetical protein Y032_0036g3157 [Ancylostoma ceylanicum]|uniref:Uncharacterized protein n=1 Tax=Ancylostoma ceylanicum TaxID=53326 RepID=A0A016UKT7_9BILA|nr:hypothetical protein Y032_0036g3157 [Ancylostoma ceylanicum]
MALTSPRFHSLRRTDNSAPLEAPGSGMLPFPMLPVHEAVQPSTAAPSGLSAPSAVDNEERCACPGRLLT